MRDAARQANEIARLGEVRLPVEQDVETPFEHVDELILLRMDMRRHHRAGRHGSVPGKARLAKLLGHIGLAEDVPGDPVHPVARLGDPRRHRIHVSPSLFGVNRARIGSLFTEGDDGKGGRRRQAGNVFGRLAGGA